MIFKEGAIIKLRRFFVTLHSLIIKEIYVKKNCLLPIYIIYFYGMR